MKKLLMIAPYFLPRRRVGALRPFKFAIHLREFGWQPHVLTISSNDQLTEKEKSLQKNIEVFELHPPMDRTQNSDGNHAMETSKIDHWTKPLEDFIDKNFPVDTWLPFFRLKYGQIKQYFKQVDPDAIWSTGDPWSAHWVGKKLKDIDPDRFWMADFRDPWTVSDIDLRNRSFWAASIDKRFEKRWIQKASALSFTSQNTRKNYEQYYAELNLRTVTIYNAFDKELFDTDQETASRELPDDCLHLLFFGKFRQLSKASPVIRILHAFDQKYPDDAGSIKMHVFGHLTDNDFKMAEQFGVLDAFEIQEPVPIEKGMQIMNNADILFLSTNQERRDIIPAKLWDYLAAERPILSIAPNEEIGQILEETGAGVQYDINDLDRIVECLKESLDAKKAGGSLPIKSRRDSQAVDEFSARSATEKLAEILDNNTV